MRKNGWHYEVWGTSEDPSTWFEQNVTLLDKGIQTPQRQLKRIEVTKEKNVINIDDGIGVEELHYQMVKLHQNVKKIHQNI